MIRQVVVASDDQIVQVYLCLNFCDFKLAHLFSRAAHSLMGTAVQLSATAVRLSHLPSILKAELNAW